MDYLTLVWAEKLQNIAESSLVLQILIFAQMVSISFSLPFAKWFTKQKLQKLYFFSGLSQKYNEFLFVAMAIPASGKYKDPQKHFDFLKDLLSDCKDLFLNTIFDRILKTKLLMIFYSLSQLHSLFC